MIVAQVIQLTLELIVTLWVMIMLARWGWRMARALLCNKTSLFHPRKEYTTLNPNPDA